MPAKSASIGPRLAARACPASRRASPGRPSGPALGGDDERQDVIRLALEVGRRRVARAGEVARPPAGLGKVADPLVVELFRPAIVSSSARARPSEPSRR